MGQSETKAFIPREHGVWAMIVGPWLVGAGLCRFAPLGYQLALVVGALLAYMGLAAALEYVRRSAVRRDRGLLAWAASYAALAAVALGPVAVAQPRIVWFGLGLLPALASELIHLKLGRERALINGMLSIASLSMLLPAAAVLGGTQLGWRPVGLALTATIGFFWGSLLFVKSSIRRRGDRGFRFACVAYHLALIPLFMALGGGALTWAFAPALARLTLLLLSRPRPALLGVAEIVTSVAFVVVALLALM